MFEIFDIKLINSKDPSYFKDKLIIRNTFDSISQESTVKHNKQGFDHENKESFDLYFTNTNSLISINKNLKYKDAYDFLNNEANIALIKYLFLNKDAMGFDRTLNDVFNRDKYLFCYVNSIKDLTIDSILYAEIGKASLNKDHKMYNLLKKLGMCK